jgi:hypothetical protein
MTKLVEKDPLHIIEEDDVQPPPRAADATGKPQVLTADTARQGPRGTPVLWVLIAGLVAIGLAWIVIHWFVY